MKEKYYCSNEECGRQLHWEDENFYYAVAGDDVLCDLCEEAYQRQRKENMPIAYPLKMRELEKERKLSNKASLQIGGFNYDEIFGDIFGGA